MKPFASTPVIVLLVAIVACSDQANPDVSFQFRETPLRQLRGVEIGMPAKALKVSRPNLRFTPALGFQENIPDYVVSYEFRSAALEHADSVPASDKLRGVFASRIFDSDESAASVWRDEVGSITKARRRPDACEQFPNGGRQARWLAGKMTIVVGVFPPELNSPVVRSRVITALASIEAMKQPPGATPIACPNP